VISERSQSVSREMRCNDFEPPLPETVRPNALCAVTPRLPCAVGTLRPRERPRRRFVQRLTGGALAVVGGRRGLTGRGRRRRQPRRPEMFHLKSARPRPETMPQSPAAILCRPQCSASVVSR